MRRLYLDGLRTAFPGWGDEARFAWCFERALAGRDPDLLLVHDGAATIAGSAITYRMLQLPGGARVRAGIMTGSWTLPSARGRGAFTRVIEESRALSPRLLAFVTAENPSRRRLEAAGALAIPSFYCRGVRALPEPPRDAVRFVYEPDEWRSQFLDRPSPVEHIESDRWRVVLEPTPANDRVLFIDGDRHDAVATLAASGRNLFCFTTGTPASDDATPGFVMTFGLDAQSWDIQNGDRM
jgi:hypothetical protein